jgi:hypothetical protein
VKGESVRKKYLMSGKNIFCFELVKLRKDLFEDNNSPQKPLVSRRSVGKCFVYFKISHAEYFLSPGITLALKSS